MVIFIFSFAAQVKTSKTCRIAEQNIQGSIENYGIYSRKFDNAIIISSVCGASVASCLLFDLRQGVQSVDPIPYYISNLYRESAITGTLLAVPSQGVLKMPRFFGKPSLNLVSALSSFIRSQRARLQSQFRVRDMLGNFCFLARSLRDTTVLM